MAPVSPPYVLGNDGQELTAINMRRVLAGILSPGIGTLTNDDLEVTEDTGSNMKVSVARGIVFVKGSSIADQGLYGCYNSGDYLITIPASDGSHDRIDAIVARVYDTEAGDGDDEWTLEVVEGTPASSPDPPSLPDSTELLAYVNVDSGVSHIENADIDDKRRPAGGQASLLYAEVYLTGDQNIGSGAGEDVNWDAKVKDNGGFWDHGSHPERFTVPEGAGGRFHVECSALWDADAGGDRRELKILDQDDNVLVEAQDVQKMGDWPTAFGPTCYASRDVNLDDGDWVKVTAFQNCGSNLALRAPFATATRFSITRLGSA